ncbi:hypothetical protein LCGC14_1449080, partial [marine sediment metagenome]
MACRHPFSAHGWHFWEIQGGGILVTRPNGSEFHTRFAVCCATCFVTANGVMQAV